MELVSTTDVTALPIAVVDTGAGNFIGEDLILWRWLNEIAGLTPIIPSSHSLFLHQVEARVHRVLI